MLSKAGGCLFEDSKNKETNKPQLAEREKRMNINTMIAKAAERPRKALSSKKKGEMRRDLSQSFADVWCAYKAVCENVTTMEHFMPHGNKAASIAKRAIATGDQELTSLACYLNDALMSIKYFQKASEVLLPIWLETMPKELHEKLRTSVSCAE